MAGAGGGGRGAGREGGEKAKETLGKRSGCISALDFAESVHF